jgi:hypothetical protein
LASAEPDGGEFENFDGLVKAAEHPRQLKSDSDRYKVPFGRLTVTGSYRVDSQRGHRKGMRSLETWGSPRQGPVWIYSTAGRSIKPREVENFP